MRTYFQFGALMLCLGLCSGCGPTPADPADSEFTGEDLKGAEAEQESVNEENTSPSPN